MFDTCSCPLNQNKPTPRERIEAWNKLQSKALPEETKIIMGWLINFRQLLIILPDNKIKAWMNEKMILDGSKQQKCWR
jgi:hypothetical protein